MAAEFAGLPLDCAEPVGPARFRCAVLDHRVLSTRWP
ncbi:hypothetical protein QFZ71_005333 [Streptomyces sp. V2I9]|nr:hypothetical protein [Streptomyces sp. V2I9]